MAPSVDAWSYRRRYGCVCIFRYRLQPFQTTSFLRLQRGNGDIYQYFVPYELILTTLCREGTDHMALLLQELEYDDDDNGGCYDLPSSLVTAPCCVSMCCARS
jgi:hypothetical protein